MSNEALYPFFRREPKNGNRKRRLSTVLWFALVSICARPTSLAFLSLPAFLMAPMMTPVAREDAPQAKAPHETPVKRVPAGPAEHARVGWAFKDKFETEHFHFYSNIPTELAERIAHISELQYRAFAEEFPDLVARKKLMAPIDIYLFSDEGSWREFLARTFNVRPPRGAQSTYHDLTRKGYYFLAEGAWEVTLSNILHENTHALVHQLAGIDPQKFEEQGYWLWEGWACTFECAWTEPGRVKPGTLCVFPPIKPANQPPSADRINTLAHSRGVALERLLQMDHRAFMAGRVFDHYAEAWSLFHFLAYERSNYRSGFRRFLAELVEKKPSQATFEKFVGPIPRVEADWLESRKNLIRVCR